MSAVARQEFRMNCTCGPPYVDTTVGYIERTIVEPNDIVTTNTASLPETTSNDERLIS